MLLILIRIFDRLLDVREDADQSPGDVATVRVCEYRRCGAPLPPAVGRGSRARFCQDGKTWGRRALNCRDAEAVLSDAETLRESDTELEDTAVSALANQVDRVLEPAQGLMEALTTIRQQLEATTAAALSARDTALAEADDHRRQRGRAEAEAAQAREIATEALQKAAVADKARVEASKERDDAQSARHLADEDRQRAEGRLAAVRDELVRVADRADAAAELAGERASALAAMSAELDATRSALADERARSQGAVTRAEAAELRTAAAAEKLEAAREEFADTVSRHQAALDSARAEAERQRAMFDQRLAELHAGHEQTVRSMHETTTTLGADLRTHTVRAEQAEHTLARVLAAVAILRENPQVELPADLAALLPSIEP